MKGPIHFSQQRVEFSYCKPQLQEEEGNTAKYSNDSAHSADDPGGRDFGSMPEAGNN
jgi:hypothetical protein